jgi:hypothetical protein
MFLPLEDVNIGVEASLNLENYMTANPDKLDQAILKNKYSQLILDARAYLIEMAKQIKQRCNFNDERLKHLSSISPYSFNKDYFRKLISSFKHLLDDRTDLQETIWIEYDQIIRSYHVDPDLREEDFNIEKFWISIFKKNKNNECVKFILLILCLPNSNACVERLFSSYKLVKTDIRNQLEIETIEALIRVKEYMRSEGVHANNIRITKEMMNKFNSEIYKNEIKNLNVI